MSALLRVLAGGIRSTIQDPGRVGHERDGVPRAGPCDPTAFEAAQRLVGNEPTAAAIEVIGAPFRFSLDSPRLVTVTGRDVSLRSRGSVGGWTSAFVRAGEEVEVVTSPSTRFAYLAVAGGIELEPVLGSRSTYLPAEVGPLARPLAAGDAIPLGPARWGADRAGRTLLHAYVREVAVIRGPHADRFAGSDLLLGGGAFEVSTRSDRMGVRLAGPRLEATGREILSFGVARGAIQVPRGGEPIVLLADSGTTGGYPVMACVITAQLGDVAQAAPGEEISFHEVDLLGAGEALRTVRSWLASI